MADYNSAYTGAQIDAAIEKAGTAVQPEAFNAHKSRHATGGADALTPANIGAEPKRLQFSGKTVSVSSWTPSPTYASFPYKAGALCTGVTADMTPEVVFSPDDALSGVFAPIAACYAGGVCIYASEIPSEDITIPTIICWKA